LRRAWWLLCLPLLGCASTPERYVPPPLPPAPPAAERPVPTVPIDAFRQEEILKLIASDPVPDITQKASRQAVQEATRRAVMRPRPDDLHRAVVIYPYQDGVLYEIWTKLLHPTDLVFSGPEEVVSVNKGEADWDVVQKVIGEPPNHQTHLIITPLIPDLKATMIVLTTKAAYYLKVTMQDKGPMLAVRWKHPASRERLPTVLNPGIYYTGYDWHAVEGAPEWMPIDIWDTGLGGHTLIRLPERANVAEVPTFYVVSNEGKAQITNWTKRGDWYVINRLITRGELRMGHASEVVRISRGASYHAVWCPSPVVTCPQGDL
jgi:type IV secretion system protein TrbG